ncbi:Phage protein [Yersinia phage fPS-53]|uniref:Phage protein n=4 Tax=Helsettvirus TaxID=2732684 RepID=A0A2H1UJB5_9CAUD|nr:Phage protein [Yersinia phage fPS-53]YP_009799197.1 Phage protein [Yersinia phage fPS-54-ocr]SOO46605.1 Phage protein [Yersinia phage fPS-89]SOO56437.1 Phage protein [Yersinia phage fPS-85]SOO56487.1 Phage protein [Yersinia phage fPS-53]SOP75987.1 Phage protein [Yersinia phage fPS-54-ocr]
MRTINQIQSEIAKLEAEMADVKEVESSQKEAVHILKNLGWKRENGTWIKPKAKSRSAYGGHKVRDYSDMVRDAFSEIRSGDKVERRGYIGKWYVRQVLPHNSVLLSRINAHRLLGDIIEANTVAVHLNELNRIK